MDIVYLSLHLNYGGVEKAIIDQANLLCNKNTVTIISLYKLDEKPAFFVDERVKIIYLINAKPNRKEFLSLLKKKKLISAFFEGLKSVKILFLKSHLIKKEIKKIKNNIIISTRVEFTKKLSRYGNKSNIKIAQEHRHHNNNKRYISMVKKSCKRLDYLLPVSEELTNFYKGIIETAKVIYIPHFINFKVNKKSKLDNYNLISIGRLEKEKGYFDLIEVFKKLNSIDSRFNLTIVGGGSLFDKLDAKIVEYNLSSKIKLTGYQNHEVINTLLENSSMYLMCSTEESFGLVLLEAMNFGVPCIAFSSAQGALEIINNKNGIIVYDRNIDEMVNSILNYFAGDRYKYAEEISKTVDYYSKENVSKIWDEFINEIKKKVENER